MKYKNISAFTILSSLVLFSCEKYQIIDQTGDVNKIDTVYLLKSDSYVSFDKYVVLYDQDDYLIKAPLYAFINGLWELTSMPLYDQYLIVTGNVIGDANQRNELIMSDYFNNDQQQYVLAHFLGSGKCYILDKSVYKPVLKLVRETWAYYCGPLCGSGGRKFYINGEIFLDITDWISK